jgi:hypothetical protein
MNGCLMVDKCRWLVMDGCVVDECVCSMGGDGWVGDGWWCVCVFDGWRWLGDVVGVSEMCVCCDECACVCGRGWR